jgi:hypothetical protein
VWAIVSTYSLRPAILPIWKVTVICADAPRASEPTGQEKIASLSSNTFAFAHRLPPTMLAEMCLGRNFPGTPSGSQPIPDSNRVFTATPGPRFTTVTV